MGCFCAVFLVLCFYWRFYWEDPFCFWRSFAHGFSSSSLFSVYWDRAVCVSMSAIISNGVGLLRIDSFYPFIFCLSPFVLCLMLDTPFFYYLIGSTNLDACWLIRRGSSAAAYRPSTSTSRTRTTRIDRPTASMEELTSPGNANWPASASHRCFRANQSGPWTRSSGIGLLVYCLQDIIDYMENAVNDLGDVSSTALWPYAIVLLLRDLGAKQNRILRETFYRLVVQNGGRHERPVSTGPTRLRDVGQRRAGMGQGMGSLVQGRLSQPLRVHQTVYKDNSHFDIGGSGSIAVSPM